MSRRELVSIRRRVSGAERHVYDAAWTSVQTAVATAGAHAWRYRSREDSELFIEFLEYGRGSDPRMNESSARLLDGLDAIAPGTVEEWADASNSS